MHRRYNTRSLGQLRGLGQIDTTPILVVAGIGGAFLLLYLALGGAAAVADKYAPA